MIKKIEVDILNKEDFIEKYNEKVVSKDLIFYLVEQAKKISKKDFIQIIIHKKCELNYECITMIQNGLKEEYTENIRYHFFNDIKQFIYLIFGILFLCGSTLISKNIILSELLSIGGWVFLWEMIEIELFSDLEIAKKRKIIKKLLNCEMKELEDY